MIKDIWKVDELADAFPDPIKPGELGMSAVLNIKIIATKVPDLAVAQALFLNECKTANGAPVPVSFCYTDRIVRRLKEDDTSSSEAKANPKPTVEGSAGKEAAPKPRRATRSPSKSVPTVSRFETGIRSIS